MIIIRDTCFSKPLSSGDSTMIRVEVKAMTEQHESGELQLAGMNVLEMNPGKSMRFIYLRARNKVGHGWCFVQSVCVLFFVLLF